MNRGEIWDVELPPPPGGQGREQTGFRPALIVSVEPDPGNPLCMIVAFTSNMRTLHFPHTLEVMPSPRNGLSKPSVALVYQLAALDRNRVVRRRGILEMESLAQVDRIIKR